MVDLAASFGTDLDPWQVDALEAGMGIKSDGTYSAKSVGVNIGRQNGKSHVLVARALAGALLFGERVIICSAHEQKTSRVLFLNLLAYFENFDELRGHVKSVVRALGREAILLRDGTHIFFPARTRSTLRGWSVDLYMADEAQLLTDQQWESAKPTLSARPNAQVWFFGTAPQLSTDAEVFGRLRSAAHSDTDPSLAWVEYGAAEGANLDDTAEWFTANPGRIGLEAMEAERRELSPEGFARERLNIWPTDRSERVFDLDAWTKLAGSGPADGSSPAALAVDSSPGRELAIAGAWLLDGDRVHVELLAAEVLDPINALQWVVERAGKRIPVVIDGASPAASMVHSLQAQKCKVILTTAADMARACGGFLDDVVAKRILHSGQAALDAAVDGARKRPIGQAGAFGWDRRDGSVFVAPLVAATLARHGAITAGRRRRGGATFA